MSISAFLERVEELRIARHVTKEELFNSGIDLFTDRALIWYRDAKKYVSTWDELVMALKKEFQPPNFYERLFEEIKKRTQGPDESIGIYLAIMSAMFGRLSCPVSEATQLRILLRNIAPFYQNQLGLISVTSVFHLKELCRKLEERREAVEAFVPPSRRQALEPDLAYIGIEPVVAVSLAETTKPPSKSKADSRQSLCYNCEQPGHRAVGCMAPWVKRCYHCKKEGFTLRTCRDCANGHSSRNGKGRR